MPTPVSALIHAATMVTAGVYLLMRASPLIEYSSTVLLICLWVGAVTTVFSSLVGLFQQDIKKVIAYSTMSQLGMMVIAVGLSSYNLALFHLVNHAFYKALLFLGAGAVIHAWADNQDLRKYGGLRAFLPLTYSVMLIASLSLVAFPFMTGFYSKDFILESAYGQFCFSSTVVYFIATIGAVFTTLYSVKVIYLTFLANPNGPLINYKQTHEGDIFISLPLIVLAVFSVFFGYITKDLFIGLGSGFFADNSLFIHPMHEIMLDTEFAVPTLFKLLPLVLTVTLSAFSLIVSEFLPSLLVLFKFTGPGYSMFSFFNQRFFVELFYNKYISAAVLKLGGQTTKVLDKGSIELLGPFGLQLGLINLSSNLSKLDTGVITSYALYILIGLISYILIPYLPLEDSGLLLLVLFASFTCINSPFKHHPSAILPLESGLLNLSQFKDFLYFMCKVVGIFLLVIALLFTYILCFLYGFIVLLGLKSSTDYSYISAPDILDYSSMLNFFSDVLIIINELTSILVNCIINESYMYGVLFALGCLTIFFAVWNDLNTIFTLWRNRKKNSFTIVNNIKKVLDRLVYIAKGVLSNRKKLFCLWLLASTITYILKYIYNLYMPVPFGFNLLSIFIMLIITLPIISLCIRALWWILHFSKTEKFSFKAWYSSITHSNILVVFVLYSISALYLSPYLLCIIYPALPIINGGGLSNGLISGVKSPSLVKLPDGLIPNHPSLKQMFNGSNVPLNISNIFLFFINSGEKIAISGDNLEKIKYNGISLMMNTHPAGGASGAGGAGGAGGASGAGGAAGGTGGGAGSGAQGNNNNNNIAGPNQAPLGNQHTGNIAGLIQPPLGFRYNGVNHTGVWGRLKANQINGPIITPTDDFNPGVVYNDRPDGSNYPYFTDLARALQHQRRLGICQLSGYIFNPDMEKMVLECLKREDPEIYRRLTYRSTNTEQVISWWTIPINNRLLDTLRNAR